MQERRALVPVDEHIGRRGDEVERPIPPVYDNPLAPDFLPSMQSLVRRLAAQQPAIAGLIFRETDPPGCDLVPGGDDMSRRLLGYNEAMRLTFLRQFHADPIDLFTPNYYRGKADTSVSLTERTYKEPYKSWMKFRRKQNLQFLRDLHGAAGALPILVQRRHVEQDMALGGSNNVGEVGRGYDSWDDSVPGSPNKGAEKEPVAPDMQAHPQSPVVLDIVSVLVFLRRRAYPPTLPQTMPDDGFVLDFTEPDEDADSDPPAHDVLPRTLPALAAYRRR